MLDFFTTNRLVDIYYGMTKRIMIAYHENVGITDGKYNRIHRADIILRFSVAATLALALLYAIYRYILAVEIPIPNSLV